MMKKIFPFGVFVAGAFLIMACAFSSGLGIFTMGQTAEAAMVPAEIEEQAGAVEQNLTAAEILIGCHDTEIMQLLGGGEEYYTEDGFTPLGRKYQTELYHEPVVFYTSFEEDRIIDSVAIWITDGTQPVSEEMVQTWQQRVSAHTGEEMKEAAHSKESGMQSWRWRTDDLLYTLRLLDDTLTLDINAVVGQLK
ncbi:MAG: hypothetical protein ACOYIE_02380 [Agathobaculum sp.]|jgi:hypothetical protein|uniref:hypothetical protein n=1 Tax=Agathobaculum sp. TaxID=2048138 RepID=UPI003D940A6F